MNTTYTFTDEHKERVFYEICELIASGRSLRSITGEGRPEGYPAMRHFLRWCSEREEWGKHYARSMDLRAETLFDEIEEIADESASDMVSVMRNRVRIDTRKWMLAKMNPRKFGDRVMTEDVTEKPKTLVLVKKDQK